jgi:hypothetical protein
MLIEIQCMRVAGFLEGVGPEAWMIVFELGRHGNELAPNPIRFRLPSINQRDDAGIESDGHAGSCNAGFNVPQHSGGDELFDRPLKPGDANDRVPALPSGVFEFLRRNVLPSREPSPLCRHRTQPTNEDALDAR